MLGQVCWVRLAGIFFHGQVCWVRLVGQVLLVRFAILDLLGMVGKDLPDSVC